MTPARFIADAENDLKESYKSYAFRDADFATQFTMCVRQTVDSIEKCLLRRDQIRNGRPCIAGIGITVRRIASWHNLGLSPEEIATQRWSIFH